MKQNKPFFAKFLEQQQAQPEAAQAVGGAATTKYPSDNDELVTLKHPSDSEDVTKISLDVAVTLKYPSDGDDYVEI